MTFLDAVILGIVEGITEFFPISSTGHLILTAELLHLPETDFLKTFQIAIQLGAILAIVALYWRKLLFDKAIIKRIIVALLPALGVGFVFYALIRQLLESSLVVVGALFIGGLVLIVYELLRKQGEEQGVTLEAMTYQTAFLVGLFQTLSVIPGVSRAGATLLGGMLLGMKRTAIVEFSFLLAVPTMVAATTLDVWKSAGLFSSADLSLLAVGFITAFLVAIAAVKFLLRFIETHTFMAFGVYRMVVAVLFFVFVL
jgi:undecaprenyl-diphosphatase